MLPFLIALQFLTIVPVQLKQIPTARQNAQSLLFYPLIGLLIGFVLFGLSIVLIKLPTILLASIVLVVWIWLTGGLHLDGLADSADAWVGGFGDRERTLKIMKDPACGPIGALSLIIVCLLKFAALYVLIEQHLNVFLVLVPMLGRSVALFLFLTTTYVRDKGLGRSMTHFLPKTITWIVFVITLSLLCMFKWCGLVVLISFLLSVVYLRFIFIKRIGGITGDTIGAAIELLETNTLITFVVAYFYIS